MSCTGGRECYDVCQCNREQEHMEYVNAGIEAKRLGYTPGVKCIWKPKEYRNKINGRKIKKAEPRLAYAGANACYIFDGPMQITIQEMSGPWANFDVEYKGTVYNCSAKYNCLTIVEEDKETYISPFTERVM